MFSFIVVVVLLALPGVCVHQGACVSSCSTRRCPCDFSGLIYVCGGFDGSSRLASTECYDEKTDVWTIGEDMHVGREGAGLVAIGDHLYCIGKPTTDDEQLPAVRCHRSISFVHSQTCGSSFFRLTQRQCHFIVHLAFLQVDTMASVYCKQSRNTVRIDRVARCDDLDKTCVADINLGRWSQMAPMLIPRSGTRQSHASDTSR
jgi:hypothetical protein